MVPPGRWFTHSFLLALKLLTAYVHRSTLPQSRIRSTAPSEREPGGVRTIQRAARKPQGCGRFSSPLRNSKTVSFYHSSGYTPSVSLSLDSSLREGAGEGCVPFNVPPGNRKVAGDFHRPYETQKPFPFTIHRGTLPQSRIRSPAPSEREPGEADAIQRTARKPEGCGRFSSPLRNSKTVSFYHSSDDTPSVSLSLDSSLREGAGKGCVPFNVPPGNRRVAGDFHRPYGTLKIFHCATQWSTG